jgi:site-specific DNA-adenine methylase
MKNHFFTGYAGNKRQEVEKICEHLDLNNITTIIEPFCGTSALSFYIAQQNPKKYKYIINDNNNFLIEIYKLLKNKKKLKAFEKEINDILKDINKEKYNTLDKKLTSTWFIHNKIYSIRPSLFPLDYKYKEIKFDDYPIKDFINNENIKIFNMDALDLFKSHCNDENTFIFFDPPYLSSCNDFYKTPSVKVYEYLNTNNIKDFKSKILLCLEDMWIIRLLFKNYEFITYEKTYETTHKKTTHCIIKNFGALEI